jgi:hypothetical protein
MSSNEAQTQTILTAESTATSKSKARPKFTAAASSQVQLLPPPVKAKDLGGIFGNGADVSHPRPLAADLPSTALGRRTINLMIATHCQLRLHFPIGAILSYVIQSIDLQMCHSWLDVSFKPKLRLIFAFDADLIYAFTALSHRLAIHVLRS